MAMRSLAYASTCGLSAILLGCSGSDPCKPAVQKGLDNAALTDCSNMEAVPMADCKCTNEVTLLGVFDENADKCEKNTDYYPDALTGQRASKDNECCSYLSAYATAEYAAGEVKAAELAPNL